MYGKACYLLVELEHKSYWMEKFLIFDKKLVGKKRLLKLDELDEIWLSVYDNALIYKEMTKIYHDINLVRWNFQVSQHVLLFNSRLRWFPGKLKSKWLGPFFVTEVCQNGAIEIQDPGDMRRFKVNGQWLKHYFEGEIQTEKVSPILSDPWIQSSS